MLKVERRGTALLRLNAQKWHGVEPENFCPQVIDRAHYVSRNNLLGRTGWVEPVERRLSRLEVMQIDPPAPLAIDSFNFTTCAPSAGLSHFRICIAGINSPRYIAGLAKLL